jgi:hypothetical protein
MSEDLLQSVRGLLLPALAPRSFEVVEAENFDSFDNALVVLRSPNLRLRITRERGQLLIDFGAAREPGQWFDSDIVLELLGLSTDTSFRGSDAGTVFRGVGAFLRTFGDELEEKLDEAHLAATKRQIEALKERRAERLFGWKPPTSRLSSPET